jgi:hypothetical protein
MRHEGKWPCRGGSFDAIKAWRQSRPDMFPDLLSLVAEDGERWQTMRSLVQQDMMRPMAAMFYIDKGRDSPT